MKRDRDNEEDQRFAALPCELPMIVLDGGLRRVMPYWFTFTLNVKERMLKKSLLSAISAEFNVAPESYYRDAIADGRILLNGERVPETTLIKG
jgi:tRNA pseudouridine synthase 9